MKAEDLKFLEWFLKFGQVDVGRATPEERNQLAAEVHALTTEGFWGHANYKRFEETAALLGATGYPDRAINAMVEAHQRFVELFQEITGCIKMVFGPDSSVSGEISLEGESEGSERQGADQDEKPNSESALPQQVIAGSRQADRLIELLRIDAIWKLAETFGRGVTVSVHASANITDLYQTPSIRAHAVGSDAGDMLQALFLRFLDGVPLQSFRWCPECGTLFIQASKRKRIYCSNLCAARKGARESRNRLKAKHPQKYKKQLRAGAERARKAYEDGLRKRGVKGKPERRPIKHKDDQPKEG